MNLSYSDQAINLALLDDIHRLNQSFVTAAIKDWDDHGQGCFAVFIQFYVAWRWLELTQSN